MKEWYVRERSFVNVMLASPQRSRDNGLKRFDSSSGYWKFIVFHHECGWLRKALKRRYLNGKYVNTNSPRISVNGGIHPPSPGNSGTSVSSVYMLASS